MFDQKGGCNKTFFFEPVFCNMSKVIGLLCPCFGQILDDVQKHYKIGISAHF